MPSLARATTMSPAAILEAENDELSVFLLLVCASFSLAFLMWRVYHVIHLRIRHIACLNNPTQLFFAIPSHTIASFKRHLLYAPIGRKRHNREIQLSSAINVGTLPTRLQAIVLVLYLATNAAFCVISIPFAESTTQALNDLRNRTGWLSVANLIPMIILAGRNNPLLTILGISFDTFNVFHRWIGRIVVLEALVHMLASTGATAITEGWLQAIQDNETDPFYQAGFIAVAAGVFILIQATSMVRHAFYETFKVLHIISAAAFFGGVWYHLSNREEAQVGWIQFVMITWAIDRLGRFIRLVKWNVGKHHSKALVEALPGGACRVSVDLARPWHALPGQHAYIYMPGVSWWASHPFTVAWTSERSHLAGDQLPATKQDYHHGPRTMTVSFVIRAFSGFTGTLYKQASAAPDGKMEVMCFLEGPYAGHHPLQSYGTLMLCAGGVGITHQMTYLQQLIAGYTNGTVATRRILLVWIIQTPEQVEWVRPWMTEILSMEKRREILRIMIFVSRPGSSKEIRSPSETVQMFPGRPNLDVLLGAEMEQQVGAMAVTVCGPGALSDDLRAAVRNRSHNGHVDFIEESFTW